jgi:hypothetical protein
MTEPTPANPRSGRLILVAAAALLVGLTITLVALLRGLGPDAVHPAAFLPERFTACGRTWHGPGSTRSLAEIRADGTDPVFLDPAPLSACPANLHPRPEQTATVVYVRVGSDAYVAYELVGGP